MKKKVIIGSPNGRRDTCMAKGLNAGSQDMNPVNLRFEPY
jgi:hypothetical protein